jgi:hypothetical protein
MFQEHEKLIPSYDDLSKRARKQAAVSAIWGLECAFRANIAYDAMQAGEKVQTVPSEFVEPIDASEMYKVLTGIAGAAIGRTSQGQDTLGSLAYQALHTKRRYYRKTDG